jgi:Flp pilus assembly CpaF family ATPase
MIASAWRTTSVAPFEKTKEDRYFHLLGPLRKYLDNDLVTAIHVNGGEEGHVWVDEFGKGLHLARETMSREARETLVSWITTETLFGRVVDHLHSVVQTDAPVYGSRCQFFAPPIGDWTMVWRQHRKNVFSLEDYADKAEITEAQYRFILDAIKSEMNLGFGGGTGSGKTTILNAGLKKKAELFPALRAVCVQDRKEIRADVVPNHLVINVRVEQERPDGTRWTYEFANGLEDAMRSDVGYLVWSEVRDPQSAVGLMLATNTGSDGLLYTTHAVSCRDIPSRIEELVRLDNKKPSQRYIVKMNEAVAFMVRDRESGRRSMTDCGFIKSYSSATGEYEFEKVA